MEKLLQNKALKGEWAWYQPFTYARVIHYYGIWPPSKFWEASEEDRAWAIAHYETEMGIEAWTAHVQKTSSEKNAESLS